MPKAKTSTPSRKYAINVLRLCDLEGPRVAPRFAAERGLKLDWVIYGGESGPVAPRFAAERGLKPFRLETSLMVEIVAPRFAAERGLKPFYGETVMRLMSGRSAVRRGARIETGLRTVEVMPKLSLRGSPRSAD